jgi:hypothetical protein
MPHIISDNQGSTDLYCFLYDKTKGAQYTLIIEETMKPELNCYMIRLNVYNMSQLLKKTMKLEA